MASMEGHTAGSTEPLVSIADALAQVAASERPAGPVDRPGRVAHLSPSGTWHPFASRVEGRSAGAHVGGGWKITHHTTEGTTAAGAIAAYRQNGGWPHFTAEWTRGGMRLFQHLPLEVAARGLINPPDQWETNRARTIQIEHVGCRETHALRERQAGGRSRAMRQSDACAAGSRSKRDVPVASCRA